MYETPVFHRAPSLFNHKIDKDGYADASNLFSIIASRQLKVEDVVFYHERDLANGISSYMLSSHRNSVVILQTDGTVQLIPMERYRVLMSGEADVKEVSILLAPNTNGISMQCSLKVGEWQEYDPMMGLMSDIDSLKIHTKIPPLKNNSYHQAMQRVADYYLNMLMILDTIQDRDRLFLELGQITAVVDKAINEEVGSVFHTELLKHKRAAVSGNYVDMMVTDLLQRTESIPDAELYKYAQAIDYIEKNIVQYNISPQALKDRLKSLRSK